jgi:dephospho-CoA kinase
MLSVGITGGIGSGKSIAVKIFNALGVPGYNADERAKYLCQYAPAVKEQIVLSFGAEAYLSDGTYNTRRVANQVFQNPEKLKILNSIVHPAVGADFENWKAMQAKLGHNYVLKEAALLFEAGTFTAMDKMITITAPLPLRIERILKRDPQRTVEEIEQIIARQWPEEDKIKKSDFVIYNDGKSSLVEQILAIHGQLSVLTAKIEKTQ